MPLGAMSITMMAIALRIIKYMEPKSANSSRSRKYKIVPIIGPSMVPIPPITTITTIKITKTVQSLTLNTATGLMRNFVIKISAPIIDVTLAATT